MRPIILALLLAALHLFSSHVTASNPAPRLEQLWVSSGFSSPEGVALVGETLLISNVVGDATNRDGAGFFK